jgi:cytochrome c biogenesis protein CcdA
MKKSSITLKWWLVAALCGLLLLSVAAPGAGAQEKPVARFIFFYSETCPYCHEVMTNYLPTVYEKYGDQVEYRYLITSESENGRLFHGLLRKLDAPPEKQGSIPALIIGDKLLVGAGEIPALLEEYIDQYLAQGGVDYPSLDNLPQAIEVLIFFDPTGDDWERLQSLVTSLTQQHGPSWFWALGADISQSESREALAQFNAALGVSAPPSGTPQALIDHQMLVGIEEMETQLPSLVKKYKAQGGVALPSLEELIDENPSPTPSPDTPSPEPNPTEPVQKPIYLAYFEKAGCQECARTAQDLSQVESEYPQLEVESYSIEEDTALNEWLCEKYNVPDEQHLASPMIFVGDDVLIGDQANFGTLMITLAKYDASGAERTWDAFDPAEGEKSLIDRFKSLGLLTVLGAGLVDGLNPCAFATLVFFISYLTFTGRRGRDVLFVGLSFAAGVFLTYLLVGVGLLRAVQSLSFFTALGKWVYLITALLCVGLAALTFRDFVKARQGQVTEMTLKLPMNLRQRIHQVIRESAQLRAFVAVAFFTGFVVSLLELACTGQVYLPTIMFVMSVPNLAAQAVFYLVLYCFMFILPLIVVFVVSYFGTTSDQLGQFVNRHTATVKLLTGLVFVGLTWWMTWTLAPLFGAHAPWNWALLGAATAIIALGVVALQLLEKSSPQDRHKRRRRRPA